MVLLLLLLLVQLPLVMHNWWRYTLRSIWDEHPPRDAEIESGRYGGPFVICRTARARPTVNLDLTPVASNLYKMMNKDMRRPRVQHCAINKHHVYCSRHTLHQLGNSGRRRQSRRLENYRRRCGPVRNPVHTARVNSDSDRDDDNVDVCHAIVMAISSETDLINEAQSEKTLNQHNWLCDLIN